MMWGRRIAASAIGGIMSDLRKRSHTLVVVGRFVATTRTCSNCGAEKEVSLEERTYECQNCGLRIDRDLNSAINNWKKIPAERRELTPVDTKAATEMMGYFNSIPHISASLVVETGSHPISQSVVAHRGTILWYSGYNLVMYNYISRKSDYGGGAST